MQALHVPFAGKEGHLTTNTSQRKLFKILDWFHEWLNLHEAAYIELGTPMEYKNYGHELTR